jgi:hypothetical protein
MAVIRHDFVIVLALVAAEAEDPPSWPAPRRSGSGSARSVGDAQKIDHGQVCGRLRMKTSRSALDRLLDPAISSVTLLTIERAARALGRRLHVEMVEA